MNNSVGDNNKKINLLMHCGNGYVFNEIYKPIIDALNGEAEVHMLFRDYNLSEKNKKIIQYLLESKKIASYRIINDYSDFDGKFKIHNYLWGSIKTMRHIKFDLFLLGDDAMLFERYLLCFAKKQKSTVAVLETGLLYRFLQKYLGKENPKQESTKKIKSYYNKISLSRGPLNKLKVLLNSVTVRFNKVLQQIRALKNHYIYPFIFTQTFFVWEKNDDMCFSSGRADALICYDPIEYDAIKYIIPNIKNLYIAKHPLQGSCKCTTKDFHNNKLLIMFSGPWDSNLSVIILHRWIQTIQRAVTLLHVDELCLRFHPRTLEDNLQKIQIINATKSFHCRVTIVDSLATPLSEDVCNYRGVIGAPSTSLRVARAACDKIPVIGLLNSGNNFQYDNNWILGKSEGINWILENENLEKKHFIVPELPYLNRPSVIEIINNVLRTQRKAT